jgi:hypothetical protein
MGEHADPALRKAAEYAAAFAAFFLLSLFVEWYILPSYGGEVHSYRMEWVLCARYIDQGILYSSGTPYCVQPPLLHYTVWLAIKAFGLGGLDWALFTGTVLSSTVAYALLKRILEAEGIRHNPWLFAAMFALLIAATSVTYFETIMSTAFLLAGYLALYHGRRGEIRGAFLLFLSLMAKALAAPLAGLMVLHYVAVNLRKSRRALALPAALAVLSAAAITAFPGIVEYTYTAHSSAPVKALDAAGLAYALSPAYPLFTKQHILLYALAAYLAYVLYRHRDITAALAASSVPFMVRHAVTAGAAVISMLYYSVPFNAFIIVSALRERAQAKPGSPRDIASILFILVLVSYGSLLYRLDPLSSQTANPDLTELQGAIAFLPDDAGPMLTGRQNRDYLLPLIEAAGARASDYGIEYIADIPTTYGIDANVGPRMRSAGIVGDIGRKAEERISPAEMALFSAQKMENAEAERKLRAGWYSALILAPPDYNGILRILNENRTHPYNCTVTLPNVYYRSRGGVHITSVMFRDRGLCETMKTKVVRYYADRFDAICAKSRIAAELIKDQVLPLNGWRMNKETGACKADGDYLDESLAEPWPISSREYAKPKDLMWFAALAAAATGTYLAAKKPMKARRRKSAR